LSAGEREALVSRALGMGATLPARGHLAFAGARSIAALGLIAVLAGCAAFGYRDAMPRLAGFERLPTMPQVRFAPGAEPFARRVAEILPAAIAKVEGVHERPFRDPPEVFLCDSDACFHRFVAERYNFTAAVVYDNRLVLSPRLYDRDPQRLEPILVHELSHVHLGQVRGHYTVAIPVWFHEGLAALAADGGGADLASDADAWRAADEGRHFLPDEQHLPWLRKRAETWNISIHVFYRQAFIYLRDLRTRDAGAFRRLLERLYEKEDFDAAFAQAMHANPARSGLAFFKRLQCAERAQGNSVCGAGAPAQ
jgi:hypothetical protein